MAVDGLDGESFAGEVRRLAPEERTRTIAVHVRLDNPDGRLRGGMFATGQIVIEEAPDAIALPETAVLNEEARDHVLVIEPGAPARRDVTLGPA